MTALNVNETFFKLACEINKVQNQNMEMMLGFDDQLKLEAEGTGSKMNRKKKLKSGK